MLVPYADEMTMQEARSRYFEVNGFGTNGGYDDAWVDFKLGPIPFPFPNTAARIRAVRIHDLHHVLTGYDTDIVGEFEISAWEIAAGCKGFAAAWVLNLGGMGGGLFRCPGRVFRAFVRGRTSRSLYGESLDSLLHTTVADTRARFIAEKSRRATIADIALFVASLAAGLTIGAILFWLFVPLVPVGLVMSSLRRRALAANSPASDAKSA